MKSTDLLQIGPPIVNHDNLYRALNETMHALRFTEAAVGRFKADTDGLERGSNTAISVAYLKNRLADAHELLAAAEGEIGRLIEHGANEY